MGLLVDLGDTLLKTTSYDLNAGITRLFSLCDQADAISMDALRTDGNALGKACEAIRSGIDYEVNFEAFHRNLFDRYGITSGYSWQELDLEFLKVSHRFVLEEGLVESLSELHRMKIPMAIVSNSFHCRKSLEWLLVEAGIEKHFRFLISSADYGFRKPHIEIFNTAIAKMGLPKEGLWFVGDKPEFDVRGALNAGLTAVWYNADVEPPSNPSPDLTVSSWNELVKRIATL